MTGDAFGPGGQRISYSLEPGAIDLGLVRSGRCPLLVEHHPYVEHLLGSVVAATVEGGELRLLCRFARGGRADEVWSLLEQGFPLVDQLRAARSSTPSRRATTWCAPCAGSWSR